MKAAAWKLTVAFSHVTPTPQRGGRARCPCLAGARVRRRGGDLRRGEGERPSHAGRETMANQQKLADLFGANNITCVDAEDREVFASAGIVADELFDVGLPDKLSGVFVLEPDAEPEAFDGVRVTLNGEEIPLVTLGAPHRDSALRYYLNPVDGHVLLAQIN